MENFGWLVAWGVLVGLDLASVAQTMISRPIVAGTVAGFILGDPMTGAGIGVILELFALEVLPVGASRYPDYGLGAVAAVATASGAPGVLGSGIGVAVGLLVAYLGGKAIHMMRIENVYDVERHRDALDAGATGAVLGVHLRSLGRDVFRTLVVVGLGLFLAMIVRRWLPLTLDGAVRLSVVIAGAAMAAAVSGVGRLTGRKMALRWFVIGLVGGLVGVLLR
jgi:mannose/fructose/N-acetylgalactosamine-specific phosphotransferase system component IIC